MSEHEHDGAEVRCIHCGGEVGDRNEVAREMIKSMIGDFVANPDLARQFFLTIKFASEQR